MGIMHTTIKPPGCTYNRKEVSNFNDAMIIVVKTAFYYLYVFCRECVIVQIYKHAKMSQYT